MLKPQHDHSSLNSDPCPSSVGVNIYIDESGDLGFCGGSDFFAFGGVIAKNSEDYLDCKTHVRRAKKKVWNQYKEDELKSSKLRGDNRKAVICELLKGQYDFAYLLLRKDQVDVHLKNTPFGLYNWLAANLVENIIVEYGFRADVNIIIDRSLTGIKQEEFNHTVHSRKLDKFPYLSNLKYKLLHCNSKTVCGIQIADMVAGCVFQHYERFEGKPYLDYNFFPRIYEKSNVKLDFFNGRHL
jgi:hypothetical protein